MSDIPPPLPPKTPPTPPPAVPPAFTSPPPPQTQGEVVRLVLEKIHRKTGLFSKVTYRLVVTDRRLIFALQEKTNVDFTRQSPDITLAQNPLNFSIPLETVRKIATYQADFESSEPDTLEVITTTEQLKFFISNYYKVQKQLKEALGALVS
jgi:hypothetical protein